MNILITGGAGYIGTELSTALLALEQVENIIVYDNLMGKNYAFFSAYKFPSKIKFIEGDLLDSRKLKSALKNVDVVYHLAALNDKNPSLDSHLFEQINHWGTSELVNAVEESGVKTFIYVSSTAVYGYGSEVFTENTPPAPTTFYATSKWRGEEQVKRLFEKKNAIIVRLGNVYGFSPANKYQGVINKFVFDAHFKGRINIHGNGRQYRSYINIYPAIEGLVKALNIPTGTYNLTHTNLQILDIVEALQQLYPSLEFIFINQHLTLEDLKVQCHPVFLPLINNIKGELKDHLEDFKQNFGF